MDFKSVWQSYISTIIRILPQPALPAAIGIDIGTSIIKIVELARCSGGFEVRYFNAQPFEAATLHETLKKMLEARQITDQTLITAVSGKGTLIRYVDMPLMSTEELRKALAYDLDKHFPFDPATIYYDCHIIEEASKDKKMSVLVTAVKKELIDDRLKVFKDAGFQLNKITTNAIATANAFGNLAGLSSEHKTAKALLDIGGSVSNLMIINERSPRFNRDIFIGANDITKQISNVLGISLVEAEKLKVSGERSEEILVASEDVLNNLMSEVRLSLDYFTTERNIAIDELYLVGGGAGLKGIVGIFEKQLGVPVKIWQPLVGVKLSPNILSTEIDPYASQLSVALGLALSAL